jgi:hypothetical protein
MKLLKSIDPQIIADGPAMRKRPRENGEVARLIISSRTDAGEPCLIDSAVEPARGLCYLAAPRRLTLAIGQVTRRRVRAARLAVTAGVAEVAQYKASRKNTRFQSPASQIPRGVT